MPALISESTAYTADMESMRKFFASGQPAGMDFRKRQLRTLKALIDENSDALVAAIAADLHRSTIEGYTTEVVQSINEIDTCLEEMDEWAKPRKVETTLLQLADKDAYIHKDPLGLVLVISPWNYPLALALSPLAGAMAAGNCVVVKPSEVSANCSAVLGKLIPQYFDPSYVRVIEGAVPETTELLKERFDHIFYTGSPAVGKVIMAAAAKHLTPVTLELGGKSPAIINSDISDMKVVARRLAWGKFLNAGQTCVAPDYVLCFEKDEKALVEGVREATEEFYGKDAQQSPDYGRIVSQRQFERLSGLLDGSNATVSMGGKRNAEDRYFQPTILTNVTLDDPIMQDEIFGPIMPIIRIKSLDEAVEIINQRSKWGGKPLALYIFTEKEEVVTDVMQRTSAGGVTVNDVLMHLTLDTLPFGGVGYSGMGRYHGKFSFDTFTHEKSVLHRKLSGEKTLWVRYPPYDENKMWWAKKLFVKRKIPKIPGLQYVLVAVVGFLFAFLGNRISS